MDGFIQSSDPIREDTISKAEPSEASRKQIRKVSYAVSCSSAFRDAVLDLAEERDVNVGDIARSIMLTFPLETIQNATDPGEPKEDDRETVTLKSGPSAGKPWRRKPRLQVRLPAGYALTDIRRALGIALDMRRGDMQARLEATAAPTWEDIVTDLRDRIARLQVTVATLAFQPLQNGVRTQAEALHILGFPPGQRPDQRQIKAQYRILAAIHHPDSEFGDHARMSQLNEAMATLRNGLR